jgi:hypothetical protein
MDEETMKPLRKELAGMEIYSSLGQPTKAWRESASEMAENVSLMYDRNTLLEALRQNGLGR